jgi:hypothetical protein
MATCPACAAEVGETDPVCPSCHLAVGLFAPVREAAGGEAAGDPAYLQTIAELIRSVDLPDGPSGPAEPVPSEAVLSSPSRFPALAPSPPAPERPGRTPAQIANLGQFPALPAPSTEDELRRQASEYLLLGRRLGLDFNELSSRLSAATLTNDVPTLSTVVREMFVHLAGALAEAYETELGFRNELAQQVPTPSADVEFEAIRGALRVGDLAGAHRRITHVRDELARVEEEWAAARILLTECDLLAETIRELGGDPDPALGPLEEGRKGLAAGQRERAERLLARSAVALWSLLEPRFFEELKRLRDRLGEARAAGTDIGVAVGDLRGVAQHLKQRNFGGTIVAYRRLREFVDGPNRPTARAAAPAEPPLGPEAPEPPT